MEFWIEPACKFANPKAEFCDHKAEADDGNARSYPCKESPLIRQVFSCALIFRRLQWLLLGRRWIFHKPCTFRSDVHYSIRTEAVTRLLATDSVKRKTSTSEICLFGTPLAAELWVLLIMDTVNCISTGRLDLRPLALDDASDVFAYARDPEVSRNTSWPTHESISDAQAFVNHVVNTRNYTTGELRVTWGIRLRDCAAVIGTICFVQDDAETGHTDYALALPYWNQGLMTEAVRAVVDWAIARLPDLKVINSGCLSRNAGSRRVLEKAGFRFCRVDEVCFGAKFNNQTLEVSQFSFHRRVN